jgi:hypothetical protein
MRPGIGIETAAAPDIAETEIFFALDDTGVWGIGFSAEEARECLLNERDDGTAIRSFSIRVRARKPHVELGPEIDIADKDVEAASVAQTPPTLEDERADLNEMVRRRRDKNAPQA